MGTPSRETRNVPRRTNDRESGEYVTDPDREGDVVIGGLCTGHTDTVTGVAWHPTGDLIATADTSGLIRISHLDGTLERAFISVRPRVPGVKSYASWTPQGLDVLEGEAWRVLRVPEPGGGSRRLEIPGLSYEPPTD